MITINLLVNIIGSNADSGGSPSPSITSSFTYNSGIYSIAYSSAQTEKNQYPIVQDVQFSGTLGTGNILTITATILNNTSYNLQGVQCKIYRAGNKVGDVETLVGTLTGNTGSFNYTQVTGDEGHNLRIGIIPIVSGGVNTTGEEVSSEYTNTIPVTPTVYDYMNIHNMKGWILANTSSLSSWSNIANPAAPSLAGTNPPSVVKGLVLFTRASSQSMSWPHSSITQPFVQYIIVKPTILNVTQYLIQYASSIGIYLNGSRNIIINNTTTGALYPNDTTKPYLIKVVYSGSSSTITIGTYTEPGGVATLTLGSPTTFNAGVASIGSFAGNLGVSSGGSFYYDGGLLYLGTGTTVLTSPQETAMLNDMKTQIYNYQH